MQSAAAWHKLPDGLAAACEAVVKVWQPHEPANEIKVNEGTNVFALDFSPNNKVLAVGGDKGQITLYGSSPQPGGKRVVGLVPAVLDGSVDAISCLRFLPDASLLGGCKNGSVLQWELRQPEAGPRLFRGLTGSATAIAVPHTMNMLAVASSSGQVLLFDIKTGVRWRSLQREGSGTPPVSQLAFSRTQPGLVAAGNAAGQLLLWDVEHMTAAAQAASIPAHKGGVTGLVASDADPDLLISCGADGRLRCHDSRTHKACWSVSGQHGLTCLAAKWDGRLLAVGGAEGSCLVQDVRAIKAPLAVQQFSDSRPVTCIAWFKPLKGSTRPAAPAAAVPASAATPAGVPAAAAAEATPTTSASSQQQQQQQQAARQEGAAATAAVVTPAAGSSSAGGGHLSSEASNGSLFADAGMRAMSPVQLYGCSSDTDLAAAAAALPGGSPGMHMPEMGCNLTPADSGLSGGGMAAFMFTPGIGLPPGAFGAATPELMAAAAAAGGGGVAGGGTETTPISRPTAIRPGAAAAAAAGGGAAGSAGPGSSSILGAAGDADAALLTGQLAKQRPSGSFRGRDSSKPGPAAAAMPGGGAAAAGSASRGAVPRSSSSSSLSAAAAPTPAASAAISKGGGAAGTPGRGVGSRAGVGAAATAAVPGGTPGRRGSRSELPDVAAAGNAGGSSRPGSAGGAGGLDGLQRGSSSRPGSAGQLPLSLDGGAAAGAAVGLREDVFRAYVDQQMAALREDVQALHLDMLRQFHQAQMDLVSVVDGLAQRQDQLTEAVAQLATAVMAQGGGKGQGQRQAGTVGLLPWL